MSRERYAFGWSELALVAVLAVLLFAIGIVIGSQFFDDTKTIDSRTTPTLVTVEVAPDGQAYCPEDPSVPHVTPCLFKP